ncbi:MAG: SPOR domain-containing protein [Bacteroidaceae bacterium]|nr:SPOR domain-containing protein [Bacteroidaceae bacterium]MBQ2186385.1 SPOR domain-containing protein [Bacteroidaceae bacterium]MBR3547698.1 SPOR domain-containing protein [Bacteroidaceae bacterium]
MTIHQSKAITDLVNGVTKSVVSQQKTTQPKQQVDTTKATAQETKQREDSTLTNLQITTGKKVRVNGYRIQVYLGGNSRQAKYEAQQMGRRVKSYIGDLAVYTHFISPHWICRVGDFRTYEEANEVFQQLKQTNNFSEAVIVKSKVYAYY